MLLLERLLLLLLLQLLLLLLLGGRQLCRSVNFLGSHSMYIKTCRHI